MPEVHIHEMPQAGSVMPLRYSYRYWPHAITDFQPIVETQTAQAILFTVNTKSKGNITAIIQTVLLL